MEQKETTNDHLRSITLPSSDIDGLLITRAKAKAPRDTSSRSAQARACFENVAYEFGQLFDLMEKLENEISELRGEVNDLTSEDYASESFVTDSIDNMDIDDKVSDKVREIMSEVTLKVEF
jgi:hypothetical protein|tara:strand:+ start:1628 stop:1990 length:363 start_codon:yes stop_codon:yes gene_type:complete